MRKYTKYIAIIAIMIMIIAIPVHANSPYKKFEDATDLIVETIPVNVTLKNSNSIKVVACDRNGVYVLSEDKHWDYYRYIFIDYNGNVYDDFQKGWTGEYYPLDDTSRLPVIFRDGVAGVQVDNKYGYINEDYEWIIKPYFFSERASDFSAGYGAAQGFLFDTSGTVCLIVDEFFYARNWTNYGRVAFSNGYAVYKVNDDIYYLDEKLNSTKVENDEKGNRSNTQYIYNGGTLVIYYKMSSGEEFIDHVYEMFGSDGKLKYKHILKLPRGHEIDPYPEVLANGNVIFYEPDELDYSSNKGDMIFVSAEGNILTKRDSIFRYWELQNIGIDRIWNKYESTCYDLNFKPLKIMTYSESDDEKSSLFERSTDGNVAVSIVSGKKSEKDNFFIKEINVIKPKDVELNRDVKVVDFERIPEYNYSEESEISVYIDYEKIDFDVSPILVDDRTLVPMRKIFEELGATVTWDDITETATAVKDGITVSVTIDSNIMLKNGEEITLDVPAMMENDRTLVPLRAVSEAFECEVKWNEGLQRVYIFTE